MSIIDKLREENEFISNKFSTMVHDINIDIDDLKELERENSELLRAAIEEGDLSENASYSTAKENAAKYSAQRVYAEKKLEDIKTCENIRYTPTGRITVGCIFAIKKLNGPEEGKEYIWKVYGKLDSVDDKILTTDCRAYQALQDKVVGDIVAIPNSVSGFVTNYEVIGVL